MFFRIYVCQQYIALKMANLQVYIKDNSAIILYNRFDYKVCQDKYYILIKVYANNDRKLSSTGVIFTHFFQAAALDKDICLLVDDQDKFIGTATKRECHRVDSEGKVLLHRAFSVFLFNKRGDMLLQRRASKKVILAFILHFNFNLVYL